MSIYLLTSSMYVHLVLQKNFELCSHYLLFMTLNMNSSLKSNIQAQKWDSVSINEGSKLRDRCKWWLPLLIVFVVSYTRNFCLKGRFAQSHDGCTICFSNPQITATNYYFTIMTIAEKCRLVFKLISVLTSILICLKCRLLPNGTRSKKDIPTKFEM